MQPSVNIQSPIVLDAPLNRGLLRWWLCLPNQNRGNRWRELTRKSDATITGATAAGSRGRHGGWGCYEYDGTNDGAQTAAINLSSINTLTVSMWIALVDDDAVNDVVVESSATSSGANTGAILILQNKSTNVFFIRVRTSDGENNWIFTGPTPGPWMHLIVCFDRNGGAQQIAAAYVNGVAQSISSSGTTGTASTGGFGNHAWNFMCRNNASLFNIGKLDDFRIYNRILSASEARELYRESAKGYPRLLRWIESPLATFASQGVANSYWAWNTYGAVA